MLRKQTLINLQNFLVRLVSFLIPPVSVVQFSVFSKLIKKPMSESRLKLRNPYLLSLGSDFAPPEEHHFTPGTSRIHPSHMNTDRSRYPVAVPRARTGAQVCGTAGTACARPVRGGLSPSFECPCLILRALQWTSRICTRSQYNYPPCKQRI